MNFFILNISNTLLSIKKNDKQIKLIKIFIKFVFLDIIKK